MGEPVGKDSGSTFNRYLHSRHPLEFTLSNILRCPYNFKSIAVRSLGERVIHAHQWKCKVRKIRT